MFNNHTQAVGAMKVFKGKIRPNFEGFVGGRDSGSEESMKARI